MDVRHHRRAGDPLARGLTAAGIPPMVMFGRTMSMTGTILFAWISLFSIAPTPAPAQHDHGVSPYAHARDNDVPTLTPDEVRGLRTGEGMGLARPAELNHFPGPKHLLKLGLDLELDHVQIERIKAIHKKMRTRAIAKGEKILSAERHLASIFASGQPSAADIERITGHLGVLRGQLQAIHLLAHIESTRELTVEQIERYDRLRGYL